MFGASPSAIVVAGITLGWRELILLLILCVGLYMGWVIWRMRRISAKSAPPATSVPVPEPEASAAADEPVTDQAPVDFPAEDLPEPLRPEAEPMMPGRDSLADEVALLRDEVDILRAELAALREDMQLELGHLRAAQTVSPIYGDAMQMATSGYDASAIAERCGIARAEAELVIALARSQMQ